MSSSQNTGDVISDIAGIEPGSRLDRLRQARPVIVRETRNTFLAIFEPEDDADLSRVEREAIAVWSATLANAPDVASWHRARLLAHGPEAERLAPLGITVDALDLTDRERALLRHTELLTLRPATATEADVSALLNAGVSPAAIVTLAQLVAFLAFEIRTIATLRALEGRAQA